MFALIDCNNFFASCERLFRPDLRSKPIIVLSSNDGCVIARSNEAKALGIPMGIPYFKIRALCKQYNIHVFSSNFTLYNDLSQRIMRVIEDTWPHVEIYSVDEAFLDLSLLDTSYHDVLCADLRHTILRHTGIPTSIGIGPSKTLAKLANHVAKKELNIPVFNVSRQREWLKQVEIGDVWGVGRKWTKRLLHHNIYTAHDLAQANTSYIKTQFNVVLQRTHLELNGISCATQTEQESPKSIISSRSFGYPQMEYSSLAAALSSHCATAWRKLRRAHLFAQYLGIFMYTNRFKDDDYYHSIDFKLIHPSDDIRYITSCAKFCLEKIYQPDRQYKKIGVVLGNLVPKSYVQMDLFNPSLGQEDRSEQFMKTMEKIQAKFGRHTIRLAAEGYNKTWLARNALKSPNYTTEWSELPLVNLGHARFKHRVSKDV